MEELPFTGVTQEAKFSAESRVANQFPFVTGGDDLGRRHCPALELSWEQPQPCWKANVRALNTPKGQGHKGISWV